MSRQTRGWVSSLHWGITWVSLVRNSGEFILESLKYERVTTKPITEHYEIIYTIKSHGGFSISSCKTRVPLELGTNVNCCAIDIFSMGTYSCATLHFSRSAFSPGSQRN